MSRTEIRITGFGGQGVVLSGYVIGRACAVNAGQHATMIQSFGKYPRPPPIMIARTKESPMAEAL